MPDFSAVTPQQVREITAECRAQLLIARQRERENAPHYRAQAERFKTLAASTRLPKVQASRFRIAASYERLAELAEGTLGLAELGMHPGQENEHPTRHGRTAQFVAERGRGARLQKRQQADCDSSPRCTVPSAVSRYPGPHARDAREAER
jgi:hypothetical protein